MNHKSKGKCLLIEGEKLPELWIILTSGYALKYFDFKRISHLGDLNHIEENVEWQLNQEKKQLNEKLI